MFVRSPTNPFGSILPRYLAPDDETGEAGEESASDEPDESQGDGRTYTQAELDRILTGRVGKADKTAKRHLLEQLGVKDEAEARKLIEAHRKASEKDKSELERERSRATEASAAAEAAKREAATMKLQVKIDRALLAADADPKRLERLSRMVFVDLEDDADDDDIKAAIESVRGDFAEAFVKSDSETEPEKKKGPAPSGAARDGKGPKGGAPVTDAMTRGRDRARQLQGREPAKSA